MAEILNGFKFPASKGFGANQAKHPWAEWLDGQVRALTSEDWGTATIQTIRMMLRKQGRKRGLIVQQMLEKETGRLIIQAVPASDEQKASWAEADAKKAAEKEGTTVEETDASDPSEEEQEAAGQTEEAEPEAPPAPVETNKQRKARERAERAAKTQE